MDFETKVQSFAGELAELLKKYNLYIGSSYISKMHKGEKITSVEIEPVNKDFGGIMFWVTTEAKK